MKKIVLVFMAVAAVGLFSCGHDTTTKSENTDTVVVDTVVVDTVNIDTLV